jgi:cation:H+ antiporter
MPSQHLLLLLGSFILIWISAGLVIDAVESSAKRMKISPFSFSFIFLGLFTSISEGVIGLTAVTEGQPAIFVGNLLGATLVIFGLILPLLALLNGGIRFNKELSPMQLLASLAYIMLPAVAVLNGSVTLLEGAMLIIGYPLLLLFVKVKRKSIVEILWGSLHSSRFNITSHTLRLVGGLLLMWFASHLLINQVVWLAETTHTSTFLVGLLVLSLGSNVPELVVAVQAVLKKQSTIAYGSYLGSAIANTLIFGLLTVINHNTIYIPDGLSFILPCILLLVALFFFFIRSHKGLSRWEGFVLISIYLLYLGGEWLLKR